MTFTREGMDQAEAIWKEGLQQFPHSPLLKVKLAYDWFVKVQSGWVTDSEAILADSWRLGNEAILDPRATPLTRTLGHMLMSELNYYYRKDYQRAMAERAMALKLTPNDFLIRASLAYIAVGSGQPEEGIASLSDIAPDRPVADWGYSAMAWGYFALRNYPAAIEAAHAAITPIPAYAFAFEAASWAELGDMEKAGIAYAKLTKDIPDISASLIRVIHQNKDVEVVDREIAALTKLGLPR